MGHLTTACASPFFVMHHQGLKEERPPVFKLPTLVLHILGHEYQLSEGVGIPRHVLFMLPRHVLFMRGKVLVLPLGLPECCLMVLSGVIHYQL
jgi:hypothetical protein